MYASIVPDANTKPKISNIVSIKKIEKLVATVSVIRLKRIKTEEICKHFLYPNLSAKKPLGISVKHMPNERTDCKNKNSEYVKPWRVRISKATGAKKIVF